MVSVANTIAQPTSLRLWCHSSLRGQVWVMLHTWKLFWTENGCGGALFVQHAHILLCSGLLFLAIIPLSLQCALFVIWFKLMLLLDKVLCDYFFVHVTFILLYCVATMSWALYGAVAVHTWHIWRSCVSMSPRKRECVCLRHCGNRVYTVYCDSLNGPRTTILSHSWPFLSGHCLQLISLSYAP